MSTKSKSRGQRIILGMKIGVTSFAGIVLALLLNSKINDIYFSPKTVVVKEALELVMPSLFDEVLYSSGNITDKHKYLCFNDRIVYWHYTNSGITTYTPDYWYGVFNVCSNWFALKEKLNEKS